MFSMGSFYAGLGYGCQWAPQLNPRGMSSGLHTPSMPFMEPLFVWASG